MGMPATLLAVLVSVGAASREGVTYRRWHNVEGGQVSEIYTDPDYQADSPDHEEVLTAFFETPVNIWYALLKCVDDFTFYSNRHGLCLSTFCSIQPHTSRTDNGFSGWRRNVCPGRAGRAAVHK